MSDGPVRIQLSRAKGWRIPENTVIVDRRTRWGNWYMVRRSRTGTRRKDGRGFAEDGPWIVVQLDKHGWETGSNWGAWADKNDATAYAVDLYRHALMGTRVELDGVLNHQHYMGELRGKNLACWCKPGAPCHADVLLELVASLPDREPPA